MNMTSSNMACSCNEFQNLKCPWFDADCFVVITGASRGFGRSLCIELIKSLTKKNNQANSLTILLMARNLNALQQTKLEMLQTKPNNSTLKLNILLSEKSLDLAQANKENLQFILEPLFEASRQLKKELVSLNLKHPQWNLLINNAGSLGNTATRADQKLDIIDQVSYYHANLIAPIILTSLFIEHFAPGQEKSHEPIAIVNISSALADLPRSLLSDYCTGKAGRQMYFKCLAMDRPSIAVFNYSPGVLATDMFEEIAKSCNSEGIDEKGLLIQPKQSAEVCIKCLSKLFYENNHLSNDINKPKFKYCPAHHQKFSDILKDLWLGPRLDYYDAVQFAALIE